VKRLSFVETGLGLKPECDVDVTMIKFFVKFDQMSKNSYTESEAQMANGK